MADFNFYLNRQGIRGAKGAKGDKGDSPTIQVETENVNEYTLRIINPDGTEIVSPNLRGNKIDTSAAGNIVLYNRDTGNLSTGKIPLATFTEEGGIRIATDDDFEILDDMSAVTPSSLSEHLGGLLTSPDGSITITQNQDTGVTELKANNGVISDELSQLKGDINDLKTSQSTQDTQINTINSELVSIQNNMLTANKIEQGENIVIEKTADNGVKISSTAKGDTDNGLEGDYLSKYGIVDYNNDSSVPLISSSGNNVSLQPTITLCCAGDTETLTSIASAMTKNLTTQDGTITLFYANGELLEAGDTVYSDTEPVDNNTNVFQAWFNPNLTTNPDRQWQFRSNDSGNVWRAVASSTPIADIKIVSGNITRIDVFRYRHIDKEGLVTTDRLATTSRAGIVQITDGSNIKIDAYGRIDTVSPTFDKFVSPLSIVNGYETPSIFESGGETNKPTDPTKAEKTWSSLSPFQNGFSNSLVSRPMNITVPPSSETKEFESIIVLPYGAEFHEVKYHSSNTSPKVEIYGSDDYNNWTLIFNNKGEKQVSRSFYCYKLLVTFTPASVTKRVNVEAILRSNINYPSLQTIKLAQVAVDDQTIQVVNGRLHANMDELGNEVNDLSSRVTILENSIGEINARLDEINGENI